MSHMYSKYISKDISLHTMQQSVTFPPHHNYNFCYQLGHVGLIGALERSFFYWLIDNEILAKKMQ